MAAHDELAQATAAELVGRISRRELSPVEVMDAAIGRIESDNERLNAFVHLDLEQARARQAESAVGSGAALGTGKATGLGHRRKWPWERERPVARVRRVAA